MNIDSLAELTDGFSCADLEYLVKNIISNAIQKQTDYNYIFGSLKSIKSISISINHDDFLSLICDIKNH